MGEMVNIKVKSPKAIAAGREGECEFEYDLGDSLEEFCDLFGKDVAYEKCKRAAVVEIQQVARAKMDAGQSPEDAAEAGASHVVGTKAPTDPLAKAKSALSKLSPEQLAEILAAAGE